MNNEKTANETVVPTGAQRVKYVPCPYVKMFELNNTQSRMSVPLGQCLVMCVMYGNSHQLPAALFGPDIVSKVVVGVTGECPEKILNSPATDILLVFAPDTDINRVKVQLECQSSWMGKPVHLKCK